MLFNLLRNFFVSFFVAIILLGTPQLAHAILIDFVPSSQDVNVGNPFEVFLKISGLGDFTAPSLSTFDLDVSFDETLLSFNNATFGDSVLGDQLDLFGLGSITSASPGTGTVNLFELSLDSASDLETLQPSEFFLAKLKFDTLATGSGVLGLNVNSLGDANGDSLDFSTGQASFRVLSNSSSVVPEPASLFLLGSGLIGMFGLYKKRK